MVYLAITQEYLVSGSDHTEWGTRYVTIEESELHATLEEILTESLDSDCVVRGKNGGYDTYTVDFGLRTTVTVYKGDYAKEDVEMHQMSEY